MLEADSLYSVCTEYTYSRVFDAVRALPAEVDQLVILLGVRKRPFLH
jgi:hypothetical protein